MRCAILILIVRKERKRKWTDKSIRLKCATTKDESYDNAMVVPGYPYTPGEMSAIIFS